MATAVAARTAAPAAAGVLEVSSVRSPGAAAAADRPAASCATDLRRQHTGVDTVAGVDGGATSFEPAPRRDGVHDTAGGLVGTAVPSQRAARCGDRHAGGEPPAPGVRIADRFLRQHAGAARAVGG